MKEKEQIRISKVWLIAISLLVVALVNFWINGLLVAGDRAFYLDDLGEAYGITHRTLLQHIMHFGANKLRPVTATLMWIVAYVVDGKFELLDEVLLCINFVNAAIIYYVIYNLVSNEISKKILFATSGAILFAVSRFAYYNITEFFGIMEGTAIAVSIVLMYMLIKYINDGKTRDYVIASLLYLIVIYIHERYFILVALFLIANVMRDKAEPKKILKFLIPLLVCVSFWVIRILIFGDRAMDGTGGTNMTDTFSLGQAIIYAVSQVGYLLGFNCGPGYLCGLSVTDTNITVNIVISLCAIVSLMVLIGYIVLLFKKKLYKQPIFLTILMLVSYIGCCIVASSTTIRVEMRWIYSSYAAFVILLFILTNEILINTESRQIKKIDSKCLIVTIMVVYTVLTSMCQMYYRNYYKRLYYWSNKMMALELYEATFGSYDKEYIESAQIIFVNSKPYYSDDALQQFFSIYADTTNMDMKYVTDMSAIFDMSSNERNTIILMEDSKNLKYAQIDNALLSVVKYDEGIYDDGWMEQEAELTVKGSGNSEIILSLYYPEERNGSEVLHVYVNDQWVCDWTLSDFITDVSIPLNQDGVNKVKVISDYYCIENSGRSEKGTLSCVLTKYAVR